MSSFSLLLSMTSTQSDVQWKEVDQQMPPMTTRLIFPWGPILFCWHISILQSFSLRVTKSICCQNLDNLLLLLKVWDYIHIMFLVRNLCALQLSFDFCFCFTNPEPNYLGLTWKPHSTKWYLISLYYNYTRKVK